MIDKRPALIAHCTGAADVIDCVNFARENDLLVAVRGGGHNVAGNAVCDGGLMIDLSRMKSVRVDPARRRAIVANLKTSPQVPWLLVVTALWLWVFWWYLNGGGWPKSTSETRRRDLRGGRLSARAKINATSI